MTKTVAVINDLSSFGNCSLTAFIAVLASMGHRPCPLPTAVLSAQSEFPVFCGQELTGMMPRYREAWLANHERFDAICTGYFADGEQLRHARDCIRSFRRKDTLVLVDPVMGDNGRLYPGYDRAACDRMKELTAEADVLTPNLTELCLLTGADHQTLTERRDAGGFWDDVAALAAPLAKHSRVIVTGVREGDDICNLVLENGSRAVIRSKRLGGSFSGTGDLFAAVVCGSLLNGSTLHDAAATAARFLERAIADTVRQPHNPLYGVNYEKYLPDLTR